MFFCLCRKNYTVPQDHITPLTQSQSQEVVNSNRDVGDEFQIFNTDDELLRSTWSNTTPYIPNLNYGRIIKCYDGDTCTIVAKLHPEEPVYRFSLRLNGIDAPEIKSKNVNEKHAAKFVKNKLCEKILNKFVYLKNVNTDKYGRILCDVFYENENVNQWLIKKKYVVTYDGGKKICPDDWCSYIGIEQP